MFRQFLSVGGLTALSRLTGFLREIVISALMGAGPLADAYFVALRLPNQFRAIFGEGAFNSAYVPTYSRLLTSVGHVRARDFASRVLTLLALSQLALLALAYLFMPQLVELIAPGFSADPQKFALAVGMTRVTFPYLAFITVATLHSGTLNAHGYFAVAAFAPVLLNLFIMAFLALSFLFPNAGLAASWGVLASGVAQLALLVNEARRRGVLERFATPRLDADVRQFLRALGPAVIGSAGQQIAILADTILASGMPTGSVSAINYADRLYQLPLGVIGVAAGTVLLPEMSRRLAAGDKRGAEAAQNRAMALSLALCAPFLIGFLLIPDEMVRGAYLRGAFTASAATRSASVLAAYGLGLIPMVLIRSAVATFQSRGDTATPANCFYAGLAVNVLLKLALSGPLGPAGLALATAAGAWINFALLIYIGHARDLAHANDRLIENIAMMLFASAGAALASLPALAFARTLAHTLPWLRNEFVLAATFGALSLAYGGLIIMATRLFGRSLRRQWL
ncbi:MAG: murein biosynthesis integral membrane protein MurJ [Pseudomonadota bacterium]|nr:murein biosynthesis integral membrane protein MurJ [Pseudomonadota bacterium]